MKNLQVTLTLKYFFLVKLHCITWNSQYTQLSIASLTVYTNPVRSRALQQRAAPPSPQTDPSASSRCAGLRSCSSWTLQERRAHITFQGKWQISGPCHWYLWRVVLKANGEKKLIPSSRLWGNRQKEEWITQEHAHGRRAELHPPPWIDGGEPLLGSWTLGRSMREGGKTEETRRFGIVQLFTLTDSLMTRWCCVCQQSCRLRMNGCLTCRCQKRTHAHAYRHTDTHWQWMKRDGQATWCPVTEWGCCYTRTVHTNSTLLLSLLVVLHAYNTESFKTSAHQDRCAAEQVRYWCTNSNLCHLHSNYSTFFCYFPQYTCMKSTMLLLAWFKCSALILESLLIFRNLKCVFPPCISIIVQLTVVHCNTWMMTSSLSCSTASCFTTFNFGRTWKQQWNTWTQSFIN